MGEESFQDVGRKLGIWIINSCKMERFTGDQIGLIERSKIKIDIYYIEVLCLSVFAASSVIIFCVDNNEQARTISNKMISEVRQLATGETVISAVLDHILVGRSEEYGKVMPDEMRRDHANTTSPIALKFLNIIKSPDDNKARLEDGAAPYYDEDGKLIRPSAFKKLEEEIGAATMLTDISMNYFYTTLKETAKILEQSGVIKQVEKEAIKTNAAQEAGRNEPQLSPRKVTTPPIARPSPNGSGLTMMLIGGALAALGLVITIGTFNSATESGGRYFLTPGLILGGLVMFAKGFFQSTTGK